MRCSEAEEVDIVQEQSEKKEESCADETSSLMKVQPKSPDADDKRSSTARELLKEIRRRASPGGWSSNWETLFEGIDHADLQSA